MKNMLLTSLFLVCIISCTGSYQKKTPQTKTATPSEKVMPTEKTKHDTMMQKDTATPQNTTLQGIDISHHQPAINWDTLKTQNIPFIFIKATGGVTYTDPKFSENWENAKKAGMLRGAYHFYYSVDNPIKQAEFFSKTMLAVSDSTDLPPVLDIETHGVNSDISIAQFQNDVTQWLNYTEKAFGRQPIIYTSKNFANKYLKDEAFAAYHLWLAEYGVDVPTPPETWAKTGWTFWQNTYSDTIPGIKGGVDHDIFKGSLQALKRLGQRD